MTVDPGNGAKNPTPVPKAPTLSTRRVVFTKVEGALEGPLGQVGVAVGQVHDRNVVMFEGNANAALGEFVEVGTVLLADLSTGVAKEMGEMSRAKTAAVVASSLANSATQAANNAAEDARKATDAVQAEVIAAKGYAESALDALGDARRENAASTKLVEEAKVAVEESAAQVRGIFTNLPGEVADQLDKTIGARELPDLETGRTVSVVGLYATVSYVAETADFLAKLAGIIISRTTREDRDAAAVQLAHARLEGSLEGLNVQMVQVAGKLKDATLIDDSVYDILTEPVELEGEPSREAISNAISALNTNIVFFAGVLSDKNKITADQNAILLDLPDVSAVEPTGLKIALKEAVTTLTESLSFINGLNMADVPATEVV